MVTEVLSPAAAVAPDPSDAAELLFAQLAFVAVREPVLLVLDDAHTELFRALAK